jgi:uncharacterized damage-inducible protein DinB
MKVDELKTHWRAVREALLVTVRKYSNGELAYAPFPIAYTVAQLMLHIAHEEEIEVVYGITRELAEVPAVFSPTAYRSIESIVRLLDETHAKTLAYLDSLDDSDMERQIGTPWGETAKLSDMLWHVLEHEIHHRGELSLMLGLLGKRGLDA